MDKLGDMATLLIQIVKLLLPISIKIDLFCRQRGKWASPMLMAGFYSSIGFPGSGDLFGDKVLVIM